MDDRSKAGADLAYAPYTLLWRTVPFLCSACDTDADDR